MLRFLFFSLLIIKPFTADCWGFWAHARINRFAVFTVPKPLFSFYKKNILYVSDHSADPDKRRYSDPQEAPRHFIDIDHYGSIDAIPRVFEDAVCMYSEDSVLAHGTVPWTVLTFYRRLISAFIACDADRILYYSACLGHYIGDAHVPLHCSSNYNGQKTGQHGIHGFWETRLPELFGDSYLLVTETAGFVSYPDSMVWEVIHESTSAVDSVLAFEKELDGFVKPDRKYSFDDRGTKVIRMYSEDYSSMYHDALGGQVERRMRSAVLRIGSMWYSAWLEAGQPELEGMSVATGDFEEPVETVATPMLKRSCE